MSVNKITYPAVKAVLIIDDDELFLTLLKTFSAKLFPGATINQFNPATSGTPPEDFNWTQYDLLFLDYDLGKGENGLDWLRRYKNVAEFPAVIMLTAQGNEELAVQAMRSGVQDYINKEKVSMARLEEAVKNALQKHDSQTMLATTQTLQTALYNKIHFYKKLKDAIGNFTRSRHSFLLQIQIDNFSEVHDDFGLLVADYLTAHVAVKIGELVDSDKYTVNITRIGDALIACLITDHTDGKGGERMAQNICDNIQDHPFAIDDKQLDFTVSIGIVQITGSENADTILLMADRACRDAAQQSGNFWAWYSVDIHPAGEKKSTRAKERREKTVIEEAVAAAPGQIIVEPGTPEKPSQPEHIEKPEALVKTGKPARSGMHVIDLTEAIKQNLIQASFRPFVALSDSASQFEADLFQLRMNVLDMNGESVPQEALMVSEFSTGNPGMLDLWVVRFALSQLLGLQKAQGGRKRGLFIRLFEESLADKKLYDWIKSLLAKIKFPNIASTIVFEINPPAFMQHKKNAMNFIAQMRDAWGTGFALYDVANASVFETCQKQAGFEFLEVSVEQTDRELIAALAESARDAGALTILEKINDAQQLNIAIECKFDYGQGDFIQPPQDKLDTGSEVIQI